jgi:hypothetical protein
MLEPARILHRRPGRLLRIAAGLMLALTALLPLAQANTGSTPPAATSHKAAPRVADVSYLLGSEERLRQLYPDASWLPPELAAGYSDLGETIRRFTVQSLQRDGVVNPVVRVTFTGDEGQRQVRISVRPVNATTRRYATVHPTWMDSAHAEAGLRSVQACQKTLNPTRCWDPKPVDGKPWAFYLPLGLPMVTQRTVLFLDYPPLPALTGQDYLHNFTMCRWGRVMGAAGAANPLQYETLLDSRPIAAPGSGVDALMPDPAFWFDGGNDLVAGSPYLGPMLSLMVAPQNAAARLTRPVAVFGTPARQAWATMIGLPRVDVLQTGITQLNDADSPGGKARQNTPWIATNHPDVTSYNCCPGDSSPTCADKRSGSISDALIRSEQTDFVAACWLQQMSGSKPPSASAALAACQQRWIDPKAPADRQSLCVQAKLDNNNPQAACKSYQDAWNYCAVHQANACATLQCDYDAADPALARQPLPIEARRPPGWQDTCRQYHSAP